MLGTSEPARDDQIATMICHLSITGWLVQPRQLPQLLNHIPGRMLRHQLLVDIADLLVLHHDPPSDAFSTAPARRESGSLIALVHDTSFCCTRTPQPQLLNHIPGQLL